MKALQINLALATALLLTSFSVNAQSNKTKETAVKQRTEAKQQIELSKEIPTAKKTVTVNATPAQRPVKVSDYMSLEKKIMAWSIDGKIPATLPKHKEGQTKEQYTGIIRDWAKNNLNLIKKEYHAKVLSK